MKIREGFVLKKVGKQAVVVAVGEMASKFNGVINLNETALFLWENLEGSNDAKELAHKLMEEYEVDEETAILNCEKFIAQLIKAKVIDE